MAKPTSGAVIRADFSKEEGGGGGRFRVPEGDYRVKIKSAKPDTSEKSGNPMVVVTFVGVDGKMKGKEFRDYFSLVPKGLWKLRQLLEALGMEVPKRAVKIPVKRLVGQEVGVTMTDEEYEGKMRSRPGDYIDLETLEESEAATDDDDDEDDEDGEDEDSEEAADLDEMDRKELKAYIKENELDVRVKQSMDEDDIREAIREAEGDEDDEDDEEEEEEEKPKRRSKKSGSKGRKKKGDDEEMAELDLDDL